MIYAFETYELDLSLHELRCAGEVVSIEPLAFQALVYVVQHRDQAVSKEELMVHLWPGQYVKDWVLVQSVVKARRAIGDTGQAQRCIKTLMGYGYRFIAPVEERTAVEPQAPARAPISRPPEARRRIEARLRVPRQEETLVMHELSLPDRGPAHPILQDVLGQDEGGQGPVVLLVLRLDVSHTGRAQQESLGGDTTRQALQLLNHVYACAGLGHTSLEDEDTARAPLLVSLGVPGGPVVAAS